MSLQYMQANLIDIENRSIYEVFIKLAKGKISSIQQCSDSVNTGLPYIMPGFIDAHIHIESAMVVPNEFAKVAVRHGTVSTVSDPHEIANVLGIKGVELMLNSASHSPFKFHFGAPSCVPATEFETAGARLGADDISLLFDRYDLKYLSEMMNYPGVINDDSEVHAKIEIAHKRGLPVDGHAPGLRGEGLRKYVASGISTDHECFTYEEGKEKLELGMKVVIREGSAARNYKALAPLIKDYADNMMFCSDDKHPDDLVLGHINELVIQAIADGYNYFDVLKMACINPVEHYNLNVGVLREGDPGDFIVVDSPEHLNVLETYIDGICVFKDGQSKISSVDNPIINQWNVSKIQEKDLQVLSQKSKLRVIEAVDGELVTNELTVPAQVEDGLIVSDSSRDILKIVVVNRYTYATPEVAFIRGFGFKRGAIASSVAHDCHNIVAVGVEDDAITEAINAIVAAGGGIAVHDGLSTKCLPLPIGGIMSERDVNYVAKAYSDIDKVAKSLGTALRAPFMTLSFMALLVIPSLKLSDKGLFDGRTFSFVDLQSD